LRVAARPAAPTTIDAESHVRNSTFGALLNFKWVARPEFDRAKVGRGGDQEDHGLDRVDAREASGAATSFIDSTLA
jgi:hypothetical protein